jgi:hypothetical protein
MRFILIVLLTTFNYSIARGQSYGYEKIIETADSIAKTNIEPHLLKYFRRDSSSIKYEFKNERWKKWKTRYGQVKKNEKTKGAFQRTSIYFSFSKNEPIMRDSYWRTGYLSWTFYIIFDNQLKLVEPLDFSFIPIYLKEQRPCDFISKDKALSISKESEIKEGIEPIVATLDFDNGLGKYCWSIVSVLTKEIHGNHFHGEADTVIVDAVTERVLFHGTTSVGAVH